MNNIFVGNLSFTATQADVQKLFEAYGTVARVVIMERKKGKSRGYGFVDMPYDDEKNKAIAELTGKEFMGREIVVSPVIPKVKGEFKPKKKFPRKWDEKKEFKPWVKNDGGAKNTWFKSEEGERPKSDSRREEKPYRREERDTRPWGKSKRASGSSSSSSKPPHKKPSTYGTKSWTSSRPSRKPIGKPGSAFKKFFKAGRPPKPSR